MLSQSDIASTPSSAEIGLLAVAYSTQQEFSPVARPVADVLSFDGWAKQ
ncbi:hypothetical protein [Amycolatopsis circi]|nr:hypothetical protein [Amycolatopsis circi]